MIFYTFAPSNSNLKRMSTLTLDKPKRKIQQQKIVLNVATRKYNFLMELLENLNFVQIEKNNDSSRKEIKDILDSEIER